MKTTYIKTQKELDNLICIESDNEVIIESDVELSLNKTLTIKGNSVLKIISKIKTEWGTHVEAWGNTHVEAWGNTHVVARENTHVVARENTHVVARENTHVVARENTHVEAWENTHVVARENTHVVARENTHVVARENTHVEAWGNTHVEAWENTAIHIFTDYSFTGTIILFSFAVAWIKKGIKAKILKKSKTSFIIRTSLDDYIKREGLEVKKSRIILFKKTDKDFKTQTGKENETSWLPGTTVSHPRWNPKSGECGEGKFHACSRTYFCDEFRIHNPTDRYVAIEVNTKDLYEWKNPEYPHKIAFREARVLYECNKIGNKI